MDNDKLEEQNLNNSLSPKRSVKIVEAKFTLTDEETINLPPDDKNDPPIPEDAT